MTAISTAIYGGGPFYTGGQPLMDELKASGFTTVVVWGPSVTPDGDLTMLPGPIVSQGQYVGDADWPGQLASLKQGATSVDKVRFMMGGWGVGSFPYIQSLIRSQGTGPESILYRNFAAMKAAIPALDGIDFDDETVYDPNTTIPFARMLHQLGYEVTFCPYTQQDFWIDCLAELNQEMPGLVSGFNLQCYSGGQGNDPGQWIAAIAAKMGPDFPAASLVYPGLWCRNGDGCASGSCPADITSQFAAWRCDGIQGGFIWLWDDIQKCASSGACGAGAPMDAAAYSAAIVAGLTGGETDVAHQGSAARRAGQGGTMTAIYGGGPFYSGGPAVIADLKASGFTTIVAWALHVSATGDLIFNDPTIVSGGNYVGDPGWPGLLAELKQGQTSVNRLVFSIGGWGVGDFPNIQALIQSQGTGPGSILYRNFAALKEAIPTLDAIDLDDETLYDEATTVAFSRMLGALGYNVTFCPYASPDFWTGCLAEIESQSPGLVTGFNLQCYAGGSGNQPQQWIDAIASAMPPGFPASGFVYPGLWCRNGPGCASGTCPAGVTAEFRDWQPSGIQGGFVWLYDDLQKCEDSGVCSGPMGSAAYASAIAQGLAARSG